MLAGLTHALRVAKAIIREKAKPLSRGRSPLWSLVRRIHLKSHPMCAACGSTRFIQVHHIVPFHMNRSLELNEGNLITLCMGKSECHLALGHGDSFNTYNPHVVPDVRVVAADPSTLPEIAAKAKAGRLKALIPETKP